MTGLTIMGCINFSIVTTVIGLHIFGFFESSSHFGWQTYQNINCTVRQVKIKVFLIQFKKMGQLVLG